MGVQLKETNEPLDTKDFSFRQWLEENEAKKAAQKIEKKHLSLTWRHLSVTGIDSRTVLGHDVLSCVNPMELVSDARGSVDDIVRFGSPRHESILTPTDYFTRPNWTSDSGRNGKYMHPFILFYFISMSQLTNKSRCWCLAAQDQDALLS